MESQLATGSLLEYWRIVRRRRGAVILIALLGAMTGVLATLPRKPVYQARASLEIRDLASHAFDIRQASPVNESGLSNTLADMQTQIKILQSDSLLDRNAAKLNSSPGETIETLRKNFKIRAIGQTRIVEILSDSTSPVRAAAFANTLVDEFIEQNMEVRWKTTQQTGGWLNKQLDGMRSNLERSDDALQAYARNSGLLFTSGNANVSEEKLRQSQLELSKAQAERVVKQSRYEVARGSPAGALSGDSIRDYDNKIADLRRQQAEMAAIYTPEYAKVKRIESQIAPLAAAREIEREAGMRRIQNEYDEALLREKLLASAYAGQAALVSEQGEKSIRYKILQREVDSNRQLYDAMLQRVKESTIAAAMSASNIRVVDAAKPPRIPYKPDLPVNAAAGLLGGAILGMAYAVMRERADRSLRGPGEAHFFLNVPELGAIPTARSRWREIRKATAGGEDRVELATWQRKPSSVAESFRAVLASILFSGENENSPRTLALTSPGPAEGKTTAVSNLGIALAELHRRVLLIDADLQRPRLHQVFGLSNERGLGTILAEPRFSDETMTGLVQRSSVPDLFVLTSGPPIVGASNLLHAVWFPRLLERLRLEFDMILIDTPPMLQAPDARVVGRLADAVILVLRAGRTTRDAAVFARRRLADDNTRVLGTILNGWNPAAARGGYPVYGKLQHQRSRSASA